MVPVGLTREAPAPNESPKPVAVGCVEDTMGIPKASTGGGDVVDNGALPEDSEALSPVICSLDGALTFAEPDVI